MKRRAFLASLAGIPILGRLIQTDPVQCCCNEMLEPSSYTITISDAESDNDCTWSDTSRLPMTY